MRTVSLGLLLIMVYVTLEEVGMKIVNMEVSWIMLNQYFGFAVVVVFLFFLFKGFSGSGGGGGGNSQKGQSSNRGGGNRSGDRGRRN